MADVFWSSGKGDPKRQFRFELTIPNNSGDPLVNVPVWVIKTATKPKVNVSVVEHTYLDNVFKYPGRVTWDNVSITLVDPAGQTDMAYALMERLGAAGYKYPTDAKEASKSLSKAKATNAVGRIVIAQVDAEGKQVETWTLINPFIASLDFGGLDYAADELSEVTLEVAYDWAQLNTSTAAPAAGLETPKSLGSAT